MRDAARTIGAFLQATKTAYAETVSNYFSDALTTTRSRIALASAIMAIALSTGVRIVDAPEVLRHFTAALEPVHGQLVVS